MKKIKKSEIFWTSILLIFLIISGVYSLELLGVLLALSSILAIIGIIESNSNDNLPILWIFLTPTAWFVLLYMGLIYVVKFLYKNIILRFNSFINGYKIY